VCANQAHCYSYLILTNGRNHAVIQLRFIMQLRRQIESGAVPGPTIFTSGRIFPDGPLNCTTPIASQ
jgi:hypothetical protein